MKEKNNPVKTQSLAEQLLDEYKVAWFDWLKSDKRHKVIDSYMYDCVKDFIGRLSAITDDFGRTLQDKMINRLQLVIDRYEINDNSDLTDEIFTDMNNAIIKVFTDYAESSLCSLLADERETIYIIGVIYAILRQYYKGDKRRYDKEQK